MVDTALEPKHYEHLLSEGFNPEHIYTMEAAGVESLTLSQALRLNFKVWDEENAKWVSSPGLKFPFTKTFAQIRCDALIERKGRTVKYITPFKAKSEAMEPKGCRVITEGAKDSWAGTLHGGIPTGCVAGVSHTRKTLPEGCGYVILFDSDGWRNPKVARSLMNSACHCNGKIQLVPELDRYPKGGLCEYFKSGASADQYAELIGTAMTPEQFLWAWMAKWQHYPAQLRAECLEVSMQFGEGLVA